MSEAKAATTSRTTRIRTWSTTSWLEKMFHQPPISAASGSLGVNSTEQLELNEYGMKMPRTHFSRDSNANTLMLAKFIEGKYDITMRWQDKQTYEVTLVTKRARGTPTRPYSLSFGSLQKSPTNTSQQDKKEIKVNAMDHFMSSIHSQKKDITRIAS